MYCGSYLQYLIIKGSAHGGQVPSYPSPSVTSLDANPYKWNGVVSTDYQRGKSKLRSKYKHNVGICRLLCNLDIDFNCWAEIEISVRLYHLNFDQSVYGPVVSRPNVCKNVTPWLEWQRAAQEQVHEHFLQKVKATINSVVYFWHCRLYQIGFLPKYPFIILSYEILMMAWISVRCRPYTT